MLKDIFVLMALTTGQHLTSKKLISNRLIESIWEHRDDLGVDNQGGFSIKNEFPGHCTEAITLSIHVDYIDTACKLIEEAGFVRVDVEGERIVFLEKCSVDWITFMLNRFVPNVKRPAPDYRSIAEKLMHGDPKK